MVLRTTRVAALAAALLAAVSLAAPAPALAQGPGNPLEPGLPQPPATPTATTPTVTATTATSAGSSSGLSGNGVLFIAVGAIVLLGGISFFIWYDARRRAPVRHAHATAGVGARSGSKRPIKPRKLSPAERRRRKRGRAR